jgi:O-antigen/teichoic acid export membrane protein
VLLRQQALSSVRWTILSSFGRTSFQFLQLIVLARLLNPSDFGAIAVVAAILAFIQIIADAGISNAVIYHRDITQQQLSSLYWLSILVSLLLGASILALSHSISDLYQQPVLAHLFVFAAFTLVIITAGQQLRVVAQKKLHFGTLAKIDLVAAGFGCFAAIFFALIDAKVYSFAIGTMITAIFTSLFLWLFLAKDWRPSRHFQWKDIRPFLQFGGFTIGNNLVGALNSQIDILLGGRMLDAKNIGFYSVPKDLTVRISNLITPIITQVGFPVMVKAQGDRALLKEIYLNAMRMTASVYFPIFFAMGLFAPEIVSVMLGPKWHDSVVILRACAALALFRSVSAPVGSLLSACGRPDLNFYWNLALLGIMPLAVWVGGRVGGPLGIATALTVIAILSYWPGWYFLVRNLCGVSFKEYMLQNAIPLGITMVAGLIIYITIMPIETSWVRLILGLFIGCFFYLALSWKFNIVWRKIIGEVIFKKNNGYFH